MNPAATLSILVKAQGIRSTAADLKGVDAAGRKAGKSFSVVGAAAKSAGLLVGGAGLAAGLKTAVSEYREAQKVGAQTNAVLKSTGRQAGVTKKHIEDLAGAISRKSGIDDEAIQSSANLLLTFTKVRNETGRGNKIFDRATQTITDMSVALGQSAKSSAIQLGKALNDPIKGITALRRVGVSFTADQEKQIKKMVESGNLMGAQKRILKELATEFGGSAAAQATAGDKLKVSLGNLAEVAGSFLVPALDKVARMLSGLINDFVEGQGIAKVIIPIFFQVRDAIASMIPSVILAVSWFKQHRDITIALVAALGLLVAPLATLAVGFAAVYASSQGFRDAIATAATAIAGFPAVVMVAVNAVIGAFNSMKAFVAGVTDAIKVEVGKWKVAFAVFGVLATIARVNMGIVVTVVKAGLVLLAPVFVGTFGVLKAIVTGAWAAIKAIVSGGLQALRGVVQVFGGVLKGDFNQIWEGVKNIFRGAGKALAGILRASIQTIIDAAKAIGTAIVKGIISGIKSAAGGIGNALKGAVKSATPDFLGIGDGIGKSIGAGSIAPIQGGAGGLMGARSVMGTFAAVGAANGLHVSSGLRSGAITSSGNQSYHSTGEAVDLAGSPAGMMKTFKTLRSRFGSRLAELIYTPGGAGIKNGRPNVYTGKVAADHFDHVHVAFDSGKPGLGDGVGRARSAAAIALGDGPGKLGGTQLANLWVRAGGDPKLAGLMARIAMAESGGDPGARNPSGATGLWQILGAMVKGNLTNPLVNARNAVAKYKAQGLGAWAASRASWGKYVGHPGISAGKGAAKGAAAAKVNPYDLAIAQSDVAIAGAARHKVGGVGGRTVGADLAKYGAILQKEKIMGARIRKIRTALKGKLTGGTRLRLTQELAQLIPEHQQLARDRAALRAGTPPTDAGASAGAVGDVGGGGDPNQPLIDAINAAAEQQKEHDALIAQQIALQETIRDEQRKFNNVSGSNYAALAKAISDVASGQIGGSVGLGFMSPSFPGGGSRY